MNKKEQIQFNLNNFLLATSIALDYVEKDVNKTSIHHLKRVAYLSLKIGQKFNFSNEQLFDLCAYALFHSNALYNCKDNIKEYCEVGQNNANKLPFLTNEKDIIKYSKEHYDGSGVFGLKEEEIPLFSQIISFADLIDTRFDLSSSDIENRRAIVMFIKSNEQRLFSLDMSEIFCDELAVDIGFWLDFQYENQLLSFLFQTLNDFSIVLDFEELLQISSIFTFLVDTKSKIVQKSSVMADFYSFDHKDKQTFLIASSLCTIGKLSIPQSIVKKTDELTSNEYEFIKAYPYYTKLVLSNIMGFKDICIWASNVQERVDGSGYPYGLTSKDLSFKERLLASLVVYEALTKAFDHTQSVEIMKTIAHSKQMDISIVKDIESQFS